MSADPQMMAQLLAAQLGGQQAPQAGGMQAQVSPLGAAAQIAQKVMLMNALRKPPQPQGYGQAISSATQTPAQLNQYQQMMGVPPSG